MQRFSATSHQQLERFRRYVAGPSLDELSMQGDEVGFQ